MNDRERLSELIHDMRNRLTVARANVEAFIDGKLSPTPGRLKALLQSLAQLEQLLNDFKESHAAVDAQVSVAEIDVCELLAREYNAIEAVAAAKGVSLSVHRCLVKLAACNHFIGDPLRISQIVSNVLLNAVRYTPAGGKIIVDCTHEADRLQVSIADSGPGVEPKERERIFRAGVRGEAAHGTAGSGYGLAIAKKFVEALGGTIDVSSSPQQLGALFTVRLPGTVYDDGGKKTRCAQCSPGLHPAD